MAISEKIHGDVAVLKISGKMMGGPETSEITDKVKSLLNDDVHKIVLDRGKVKWLNSSGLGALIESRRLITEQKGTLKIASATDKIKSLLIITQITKLFETFETSDRALASFQSTS